MLYSQILDPFALAQHICTQSAFYKIRINADGIQRQNGHICETAQTEGQGNADSPDKAAVEQEGDKGLTAGTKGKVGGVGIGVEGHGAGADTDEPCGQVPNAVAGVVDSGENSGETGHQTAEEQTGSNGQGEQLPVAVPEGFFRVAGTQHLPHDDADGISHGQEYNAGKVEQGRGDVHGRHNIQPAGGIALVQEGHTAGPEEFVAQKGHSFYDDGFQQPARDIRRAESTHNKTVFVVVQMSPAGNHGKLHETGNDSSQSSTFHTHGWSTEMAENEGIIQNKVHQNRRNSGSHRHHGLAGFAKGAGIGVGQRKGQKSPDHDSKVLKSVFHGTGGNGRIAFAGQIQADQETSAQPEDQNAQQGNDQTGYEFKTEGMADSVVVPGTVELGGKNTGTGAGTEYAQIKNKQQSVDNGNTAHGDGTHLADHNIIQKGNEICNTILDHDRHGDPQASAVECPVANISLEHKNTSVQMEIFYKYTDIRLQMQIIFLLRKENIRNS